jgi:hypothetical protein
MEDYIERHVAYLEGYTWHIACIYLVLLLYLELILGGCTCGDTSLFMEVYILLFHGFLALSKP